MTNEKNIAMSEQDIFIMRLYSSARSWNDACQLLVEAEKIDHRLRFSLNSSLSLATELSIKTILAIAGHNEKCLTSSKHRLSELFDKLGEENLNIISSAFSAAYKTNIGEEIDFKKLIKQHDGAFIEWRYLNFVKDANNLKDNFDYQFMVNLQKTTGNMMEKIHKLYMQGAK